MSSEVEKDDVTVIWDKSKCIHSAMCVNGLPQVFKPSEKRWIQVENATKEELVAQVNKCPSGALSMK
jgi:uncharacterized Fe-S cluster protein YjdI